MLPLLRVNWRSSLCYTVPDEGLTSRSGAAKPLDLVEGEELSSNPLL
jgi:hypothetical protein